MLATARNQLPTRGKRELSTTCVAKGVATNNINTEHTRQTDVRRLSRYVYWFPARRSNTVKAQGRHRCSPIRLSR